MSLGLVAKNAILIVDFANQQKEKGIVHNGCAHCRRKRTPSADSDDYIFDDPWNVTHGACIGCGSRDKKLDVMVIIGALTSSMIFTLVLVPAVYVVVNVSKAGC